LRELSAICTGAAVANKKTIQRTSHKTTHHPKRQRRTTIRKREEVKTLLEMR
jgi:hypothetical protein